MSEERPERERFSLASGALAMSLAALLSGIARAFIDFRYVTELTELLVPVTIAMQLRCRRMRT